MSIAVIFPGQGSQAPGSGRPWRDHPAWTLIDEAEAATGLPLAYLVLDAPADELRRTRAAQLSVLLTSLLAWRALEPTLDRDEIVAVAGHSLGQITALIAAEVLTLADGITLAVARAEATAAAQLARPGGMLAFLGATETQAIAACADRAWIANLNGAGQIVVGGDLDALGTVADAAPPLGIRRVQSLPVDGAFHTPLMRAAAEALAPQLERMSYAAPRIPIITNDGALVTSAEGWPARLADHLVQPVRWGETVEQLRLLGATTVIESGPGTTLTGLVRRIAPEIDAQSVSSPAQLPGQVVR